MVTSSTLNTYLRDNLNFLFNNDLTLFGLSPSSSPPSGLNGTMRAYTFKVNAASIAPGTFFRLMRLSLGVPVIALVRRGSKVQRFIFVTNTGASTTPQIVPPEYTVGEESGASAMATVYDTTTSVWVGLFVKPADFGARSGEYEVIVFTDGSGVLTVLDEPQPVEVPWSVGKFSWSLAPERPLFGHTTAYESSGTTQLAVPLRDWNETEVEGEFGFAVIHGYVYASATGDLYLSFTGEPNSDRSWLVRSVYVENTTYVQTSSGNGANPFIIARTRAFMPTHFRVFLWRMPFDIFASVYATYVDSGNLNSLFISVARQRIQQGGSYDAIYITPSNGVVNHGTAVAQCTNW
jgi:hypothetical protein